MDMDRCGFCGRVAEEDEFNVCVACGGAHCVHCPPTCCDALVASAVDYWLMGLAGLELGL